MSTRVVGWNPNIGDTVVCVEPGMCWRLEKDKTYTIIDVQYEPRVECLLVEVDLVKGMMFNADRFQLKR